MDDNKNKNGQAGMSAAFDALMQIRTADFPEFPIPAREKTRPVPIGENEHLSLAALVHYLAYCRDGIENAEAAVLADLLDRFNISKLAMLPVAQFENAVKYLVDQIPDSG